MLASSGTTAGATSGDGAITLIANANGETAYFVEGINNGTVDGFLSFDGGTTWMFLPKSSVRQWNLQRSPRSVVVQAKRIPGGTDITGIYASAW